MMAQQQIERGWWSSGFHSRTPEEARGGMEDGPLVARGAGELEAEDARRGTLGLGVELGDDRQAVVGALGGALVYGVGIEEEAASTPSAGDVDVEGVGDEVVLEARRREGVRFKVGEAVRAFGDLRRVARVAVDVVEEEEQLEAAADAVVVPEGRDVVVGGLEAPQVGRLVAVEDDGGTEVRLEGFLHRVVPQEPRLEGRQRDPRRRHAAARRRRHVRMQGSAPAAVLFLAPVWVVVVVVVVGR
mmetsp:Transcript_19645/g.63146  ORF Transcript_19645/g.63146 Transcript_19645/m.63146 type:complete len:244 (-) Transcript_19645:16-747(-)